MDSALLAPDAFAASYAKLGMTRNYRNQLISNANDALRIVRDAAKVTADEIDATVERIAQSNYAERENRPATVKEALVKGLFTKPTAWLIQSSGDFLEKHDVRKGLALIENAPTTYSYLSDKPANPSFLNKFSNNEYCERVTCDIEYEKYAALLRELALVSAVCREMGGFDPQAEIKFAFKRNGLAFEPFAEAVRQDANLARLTAKFVQKL